MSLILSNVAVLVSVRHLEVVVKRKIARGGARGDRGACALPPPPNIFEILKS